MALPQRGSDDKSRVPLDFDQHSRILGVQGDGPASLNPLGKAGSPFGRREHRGERSRQGPQDSCLILAGGAVPEDDLGAAVHPVALDVVLGLSIPCPSLPRAA